MKLETVAVVGLGYVGLPLAVALSETARVIGFELSKARIHELRQNHDRLGEVSETALDGAEVAFTGEADALAGADAYLITVPTPVDSAKQPDLSLVLDACRTVGGALGPGAVVVLESTVYPGTVEEVCAPVLEQASGLRAGEDFFLGYSPERINPGDADHQLGQITKVVAGQTPEVLSALTKLYGAIGPVHEAPDIRTAEAAKVIENAQRDLNIAFVNELAMIFQRLGIDTGAVLEAAATKWNFLGFRPGLVGGHCIGVDPYYLTYIAERAGYRPEVILAGRRINDNMGRYVGAEVARLMIRSDLPKRVLVLGVTFKENVRDIRNSGSVDVVRELESFGFAVDLHDPLADPEGVAAEHGLRLIQTPGDNYGAVVLTVAHDAYTAWSARDVEDRLVDDGLVADIKGAWHGLTFAPRVKMWRL
ncbi:MAG: nucleotide sugar dehydrogenase [Alphaproteobacteria bacterium]|jgi:UDP-N-acetyl-D-galactosamine dehydrogenase|nr:nucleotide sugar dehydrogenase [Alphaproteobacteria bacterium]MDP6515340.1 nucleotide sugar dehydrogenase [Alphaproteobacteria bacterium]